MKHIEELEKKIRGGMLAIRNKSMTPKEAGLGIFFTKLKSLDEALYEQLLNQYKELLKTK